jgi:hypothetical protein
MKNVKSLVSIVKSKCMAGVFFTCAATGVFASEGVAICAIEQAIACSPFTECDRNLPGAFNIPVLIKLDRAGSRMTSVTIGGQELTSEISSIIDTETEVVLSGVDNGHPWTASIAGDTGRMSATVIQSDDTFILFGECSWELTQ